MDHIETYGAHDGAAQEATTQPGGVKRDNNHCDSSPNDCEKLVKAKRHDVQLPDVASVDHKLAEKLDSLLSLGSDTKAQRAAKPKFFLHKLRSSSNDDTAQSSDNDISKEKILPIIGHDDPASKMKPRNLTKEELRERLLKKYDTLVPELDPNRPKDIKVVKILTSKESIELAKEQAKKQLERQIHLSSVYENQQAHSTGLASFRFNDGYELPDRKFAPDDQSVEGKQLESECSGGQPKEDDTAMPQIEVLSKEDTILTRSILQSKLNNSKLDSEPARSLATKKSVRFSPVTEVNKCARYENEDDDDDDDDDDDNEDEDQEDEEDEDDDEDDEDEDEDEEEGDDEDDDEDEDNNVDCHDCDVSAEGNSSGAAQTKN